MVTKKMDGWESGRGTGSVVYVCTDETPRKENKKRRERKSCICEKNGLGTGESERGGVKTQLRRKRIEIEESKQN